MNLTNGLVNAARTASDIYARGAQADSEIEGRSKLAQQAADIQLERDRRLEELKTKSGDAQRVAQVQRIDAESGNIAEKAIAPKRGLINAGIADPSTWTPEQQAVVDQSLAADKEKVLADPNTRTRAAIATGDISPKDAATMDSRSEIAAAKNESYLLNVQAKLDMAADKLEMAKTIANIRAASGGGSDGKDPANAKMIEYLVKNGTPREQATTMVLGDNSGKTKDPVGLAAQLATALIRDGIRVPKDAPPGTTPASYAMDVATQQIEAATKKLRGDGDASKPGAKPAAATPKAGPTPLPTGAKQIGTSGGKPVYETPDGKRFIQK